MFMSRIRAIFTSAPAHAFGNTCVTWYYIICLYLFFLPFGLMTMLVYRIIYSVEYKSPWGSESQMKKKRM